MDSIRICIKDLKRSLGHDIYFREGLPTFQLNMSDINLKYSNIIVLDDLMGLAVDSEIISKLFTQGRHRNASVILLLQNAFPKGKHNTSISRNAQYITLFRCPADRRQIGIMAERIFDKQKSLLMSIYNDVTIKLILTFWLLIKPIHPFVDRLSVMSLVYACHTHCQEC